MTSRQPRKKRKKRTSSTAKWKKTFKRKASLLLKWLAAVVVVTAIIHALFPHFPLSLISSSPSPSGNSYDGIDVSKYQGKINWEKVATDKQIQFVYVKATEGASLVDRNYKRNIKGARQAGIRTGSYHFFTSRRPAKEQFEHFRHHVKKSEQDLLPMVDVEESGVRGLSRSDLQQRLDEFMQLVKQEYGKYPLLYSQYGFYNKMLAPEFNKYFIFIARYGKSTPSLHGPGKHNIWQFTEKGSINGISGHVDLDKFDNGTTLRDILLD
ncbi:MAG: glycoside hydrolase family 25 protein [Prevotella sp.]|nr:glycoside hydrolase family 25 protein [Prevotella sp.]